MAPLHHPSNSVTPADLRRCKLMETMMKRLLIPIAIATLAVGGPAVASHVEHLDIPYPSRGACEAATADLSSDDRDFLQLAFPAFFRSAGEVESFLARAFSCERGDDGNWYITDHREEVLESDWFQKRR